MQDTKRKNRVIQIVMAVILFLDTIFLGPLSAYADTGYDKTAPVLNKLTIANANNISTEKGMDVTFDLKEDGVGVTSITLDFIGKKTGNQTNISYIADEETGRNPLYTGKTTVSLSFADRIFFKEEYTLTGVLLADANGNDAYYAVNDASAWWKTSTTTIKVTSSSYTDYTKPKITSLNIKNANSLDTSKGTIQIEVTVVEDGVGIGSMSFEFQSESGTTVYTGWTTNSITPNGKELKTGTHTIQAYVDDNFYKGTYQLVSVSATDLNGNFLGYSKDSDVIGYTFDEKVWSNYTQSVTVTKSKYNDYAAPTISKISLNDTKVVTPNVLSIPMTITTDEDGVNWIIVDLENEQGDSICLMNTPQSPIHSGKKNIKFTISPYVGSGTYHIKQITISSQSGKSTYYEEDTLSAIPGFTNPTITIKSAFDIAYYGATANIKGAVNAINEMDEGQVAVLDYRNYNKANSKIFEAIAGKDKTVVFENADIQWVFNGKTVKKSLCKTINLEVLISKQKEQTMDT